MDSSNETLAFNERNEGRIARLLPHYPRREAALIPVLHIASEQFGHLSDPVIELVARTLDVPPSKVLSVISFYTMLSRDKRGKYHIQVCRTLSCALRGSEKILEHLQNKLGIRPGETTEDGLFTLSTAECLASCGTAPVLQINNENYDENLTIERVDEILEECRKGVR